MIDYWEVQKMIAWNSTTATVADNCDMTASKYAVFGLKRTGVDNMTERMEELR